MTTTYRELELVCKAKGLKCKAGTNGNIWKGILNGVYVKIAIHKHSGGRDIPTGLFNTYIKQLGFNSTQGYRDFLNNL